MSVPYDDPNVAEAIAEGVPLSDIQIVICEACGQPSYYSANTGFECSWCNEDLNDEEMETYTLDSYIGEALPEESA